MLEGKNIILRLFREEDVEECVSLENNYAERGEFIGARFHSLTKQKKEFGETGWWEDDKGYMLITDKQGRKLGIIVFFKAAFYDAGYEVGYELYRRADRGRGYGTEALRIFSAYLFELKPIPRLQVTLVTGNAASRRIAEKCGYKYEGVRRQSGFVNGKHIDADVLSLLREECPSLAEALTT